jgi:hypothetical protein
LSDETKSGWAFLVPQLSQIARDSPSYGSKFEAQSHPVGRFA